MWKLREAELTGVGSVRLSMANIDGNATYVDFVSEQAFDNYMKSLTEHFFAAATKSISRLWRVIDRIGWGPGQAERILAKVTLSPRKNPKNKAPSSQ